ncbi:MAG: SMR family transporter [Candidatus Peregrinibacteria bacterium]|nr:SMR family transporter [Candidatus Peregrinibacteria bacterium]
MNPFWLYITGILVFDVIAMTSAKLWSIHEKHAYLIVTMVAFAITGLLLAKSLKYEGVAIVNIIWIALSAILVAGVGYFWFKENITTIQWIGVAIIVLGLALINAK